MSYRREGRGSWQQQQSNYTHLELDSQLEIERSGETKGENKSRQQGKSEEGESIVDLDDVAMKQVELLSHA